jgi:hypothetical protein
MPSCLTFSQKDWSASKFVWAIRAGQKYRAPARKRNMIARVTSSCPSHYTD